MPAAAWLSLSPVAAFAQGPGPGLGASQAIGTAPVPLVEIRPAQPSGSYVELGGGVAHLSEDNPPWNGQYLKGVWQPDTASTWYGEVTNARRYGDHGVLFSVGASQVFNPDWYGSLFAGTSSGGFFFPRYRVDGFINRKWLPDRNLVTTFGIGYERAKDVHRDRRVFLGLTYYFPQPWIVEGGVRLNVSDPGGIRAPRAFAALTEGRDRDHYVIVRFEAGREAYQLVGDQNVLSDFSSRVASLAWRQWIGTTDGGFQVRLEYYTNPYYSRTGIEVGLFHAF